MIPVLTPAEMREVDRRAIAAGIPGAILMENAACRVVEFLVERFSPLASHRIAVVCGKGNNGGDGLAIARQLLTRFAPAGLQVFLPWRDLEGDAALQLGMYTAVGGVFAAAGEPIDPRATLVIDALLGTGLRGPATGEAREWIRRINAASATVVSVDIPSGLSENGEHVQAHHTITFEAPKTVMAGSLHRACGEMIVARIGVPPGLLSSRLAISELADFAPLLAPRSANSHKGTYGHVLVVGGAPGKTGAAAMAGLAALRAGAGLVTVASSSHTGGAHELMHAPLDGFTLDRISVAAVGPGLGTERAEMVRTLVRDAPIPVVVDADGLNSLAGMGVPPWPKDAHPRILTPHPGEMSRLHAGTGDRTEDARALAARWRCCLVLKGNRTVIAYPDGMTFWNPTGTPAMAKAGSGDILTGLIAGLIAQFPAQWELAVRCAVYLHGRAGELAAKDLGEKAVLATDLLRYLYAGI